MIGISAAVKIPEQEIWTGTSGISTPAELLRTDMLFDIGSAGKNFIAALVLQLVEEEKLSLEDSLNKWLSDYPNVHNTTTIRQLLNCTSGIYDYVEHPLCPVQKRFITIDYTKEWTPEEILTTLVREPYFMPGTSWHYSSTNYILLKMIIEKITQSTVAEEIQSRFLTPLNLDNTLVFFKEPLPTHLSIAHNWHDTDWDGLPEDISSNPRIWLYTASPLLIYSTAEDMVKWSQAFYNGNILSMASLDEMLTFVSPTPGEPQLSGYGLGTSKYVVQGKEMWGHGGSIRGYCAIILYLPEYQTSIAALGNDDNGESLGYIFNSLVKVIVDYLSSRG